MGTYRLPGLIVLLIAFCSPISATAQTPYDENICDGLSGASWGLCNAYCEVMDCDSESPMASPEACSRVLANFARNSDGPIPCSPLECEFEVSGTYCPCNTSPITCAQAPPDCPHGSVLAVQNFCWECVEPRTCNPIYLDLGKPGSPFVGW